MAKYPKQITIKQKGPCEVFYKLALRRLKVGEKIKFSDWCCDPRSDAPAEVMYEDKFSIIGESHHPHYRIEIETVRK